MPSPRRRPIRRERPTERGPLHLVERPPRDSRVHSSKTRGRGGRSLSSQGSQRRRRRGRLHTSPSQNSPKSRRLDHNCPSVRNESYYVSPTLPFTDRESPLDLRNSTCQTVVALVSTLRGSWRVAVWARLSSDAHGSHEKYGRSEIVIGETCLFWTTTGTRTVDTILIHIWVGLLDQSCLKRPSFTPTTTFNIQKSTPLRLSTLLTVTVSQGLSSQCDTTSPGVRLRGPNPSTVSSISFVSVLGAGSKGSLL